MKESLMQVHAWLNTSYGRIHAQIMFNGWQLKEFMYQGRSCKWRLFYEHVFEDSWTVIKEEPTWGRFMHIQVDHSSIQGTFKLHSAKGGVRTSKVCTFMN